MQGVLGVFLREPLADWQREARLLQTGASADAEEEYISLKASLLSTLHWMTQALLLVMHPLSRNKPALEADLVRTTKAHMKPDTGNVCQAAAVGRPPGRADGR